MLQAGVYFYQRYRCFTLVQDFIKAQPAVRCGRRLPRLIFLRCIPFCSFLAPENSQVGTSCSVPYIKTVQGNHQCICLNSDGASDGTECGSFSSGVMQGDTSSGSSSPLMSLLSCRGRCNYLGTEDESTRQHGMLHPSERSAETVGAEFNADRCGFKSCAAEVSPLVLQRGSLLICTMG